MRIPTYETDRHRVIGGVRHDRRQQATGHVHEPTQPEPHHSDPQPEDHRTPAADVREPEHLQRELDEAKAQGQWVLVDYYADWCVSCKVMEREVFGNTEVQARLADVIQTL